ncbi:MAG: carbohydrate kinase, partial [Clostridia bacterium]|nr:carbohydrate kinase [Clostridia bacterium]
EYIAVAGGGSQSDTICQIAADVFNLPVKRVQTYETSALGAAIVTFASCGVYVDIPTAAEQMVRYTDEFTPNPDNVKVYDRIYKKVYLKMYKKLKKLYKSMSQVQPD